MERQTVQTGQIDRPVPVYILSESARAPRTRVARRMFNDPMFTANIVTAETPKDFSIENMEHPNRAEEIYRVRRVLEYSKAQGDEDLILIKDTTTTSSSPAVIADTVRSILESDDRADITYLSSWLDNSEKLTNKRYLANKRTVVAKSFSPPGVQALLLSPTGRNILLGEATMKSGGLFGISDAPLSINLTREIEAGEITADVVVPSIFDYDVSNKGNKWKSTPCRPKVNSDIPDILNDIIPDESLEDSSLDQYEQINGYVGLSPVVLIFLLLLILLILWAIYYYMSRKV